MGKKGPIVRSREDWERKPDMDTLRGKIAAALRAVRWRRGYTQGEVMYNAKMPATRIAVLEGAVHAYSIDTLEAWCKGLGVQVTFTVRYVSANGDVKVHSLTHGELEYGKRTSED